MVEKGGGGGERVGGGGGGENRWDMVAGLLQG